MKLKWTGKALSDLTRLYPGLDRPRAATLAHAGRSLTAAAQPGFRRSGFSREVRCDADAIRG
ncbi:hypothetical protein [Chitinimonas koreensis]|uniref:hypothetical protein n=1 Tax=Chitinimonas koreensis TaxID=356302 RepID=UPI001654B21E|nr:hypothetical protein [Chitinimonas koreensis]QNM94759.1 hypothetical protein H9L41_12500 [Chitinimonas koreensis]